MKQFTFLQEGSNRILSKVQKSFWSCTHVNSCQKYTLYINLPILLNIYPRQLQIFKNQEIHQVLEKITRIDQKHQNSLCLVIT